MNNGERQPDMLAMLRLAYHGSAYDAAGITFDRFLNADRCPPDGDFDPELHRLKNQYLDVTEDPAES